MRLIILTLMILYALPSKSQERFNKVINSLGQNNQSRLFDSYCDSNIIFFLGDLMDSIHNPLDPMVRPWLGKMNYNGEIIHQYILQNNELKGDIAVTGSRIIDAANAALLYNTTMIDTNDVWHSVVIKLGKLDLSILDYAILNNYIDSTKATIPGWISTLPGSENNILISNLLMDGNYYNNSIVFLDSALNVKLNILVKDNGRNNYTFYCEMNADSTISLVGDSWKRNDLSILPDVKPFYMKINMSGEILKFELAKGLPDKTIAFTTRDSYTVSKDNKGNWLFSAIKLVQTGNCGGCYYMLPYVFSYSAEFDTMNWAYCYAENLNDHEQIYSIYSSKFDTTDQSYIVIGNRLSDFPNSSYIFKIRENGDSLWIRHFIPLSWDPDTVIWAILEDIQISPKGGYISVGHVSDQVSQMWRSWIVNIDADGCLIPGCELHVNTTESETIEYPSFSVYPNPTSSLLYINSNVDSEKKYVISLVGMNGEIVKSTQFYPNIGYQYLLDLPDYLNGIYILRIQDNLANIVYTGKVIID